MSISVLSIYNAAISVAGGKGRLSSLAQSSKERGACDTWYEIVRNTVQEAAYWPSVKSAQRLTLLATRTTSADWASTDPHNPYLYKYQLPNDNLRPWHLHDYGPFELLSDPTDGTVHLHTNTVNAVLTYARINDNPSQWLASQQQATIWALGGHIVPEISGKSALMQRNMDMANELLLMAQSSAANQQHAQMETVPPALAARGVTPSLPDRFFYQHGSLFQAGLSANV